MAWRSMEASLSFPTPTLRSGAWIPMRPASTVAWFSLAQVQLPRRGHEVGEELGPTRAGFCQVSAK